MINFVELEYLDEYNVSNYGSNLSKGRNIYYKKTFFNINSILSITPSDYFHANFQYFTEITLSIMSNELGNSTILLKHDKIYVKETPEELIQKINKQLFDQNFIGHLK